MRTLSVLATAALAASPALAQDLCEGNGHGEAYIQVGPAYLGGPFVHDVGSPNVPNGICFFSVSGGFQETVHPIVGPLCLDVFSPFYQVLVLPTGPDGNLHFALGLPDIPSWVGNPPFYSNVVTFEGGQLSVSKTVPLWFENPDSWTETGSMAEERILHTATYLGEDGRDNRIRVLIAGGAVGTVTVPTDINPRTEIFDPLGRTFSPGPDMSVPRAAHTATRLADGRVLLAGGVDPTGLGHATAELFDLGAGTMTPTGSMTKPRLGHTATLLDDGRVLVAGGFQHYQNPATAWEAALDSAQDTAEIYDPATGTWTLLAQAMQSTRAGHSATMLPDGRVLIVGGVWSGGVGSGIFGPGGIVPFFTVSAELFDPLTDSLVPTADIPGGRAFHGASVLASGDVLITGGTLTNGLSGEAGSTTSCYVWDGSSWAITAHLPVAVAWHNQVALADGTALICGGLQAGSALIPAVDGVYVHDGTRLTTVTSIGVNEGLPGSEPVSLGGMALARMHDGALLLVGGIAGAIFPTGPSLRSFVYTPGL